MFTKLHLEVSSYQLKVFLPNTHLASERFQIAFAVTSQANFRVYAFNSTHRKFSTILLAIGLSLLTRMLWFEFSGIHFEEVDRLLWMLASNIVEGTGGDVVGLALSNQGVVLEQILNFGSI